MVIYQKNEAKYDLDRETTWADDRQHPIPIPLHSIELDSKGHKIAWHEALASSESLQ